MENNDKKSTMNKAKIRLLIIVGVVFSLLLLLVLASVLIDMYESNQEPTNNEINFDFYVPDYNEDIFQNEEYIDKIAGGFISLEKNGTTVGINRESASEYGNEVDFIVEMLYDIINGDHTEYNSRFSSEYYKDHARKEKFTMQMLYDVKISYVSEKIVDTDNGKYTEYVYTIEYRILRNNGTFRRDIGNGARLQYLTITDKTGELRIDALVTPTYK